VVIPTALFFAWNPRLFNLQTKLPRRTIGLTAILTGLTPLDFYLEWHYALIYRGLVLTVELLIVKSALVGSAVVVNDARDGTAIISAQSADTLDSFCVAELVRLSISRRTSITNSAIIAC
jgi:hypothetical protein